MKEPSKRGKTGIARVFRNGRSQAVRLPRDFRVPGDRVRVLRVGRSVVLEPILDIPEWFAELDRLGPEPFLEEGRNQPSAPTRAFE